MVSDLKAAWIENALSLSLLDLGNHFSPSWHTLPISKRWKLLIGPLSSPAYL
jgi:hypothetical protein